MLFISWIDFRDRHNQQSKKKAGEAALKAGNHEEAHRLFSEACDVDKHNKKYRLVSVDATVELNLLSPTRHLLRESKQEHLKATRIDFYALLGLEKSAGESEIKKAYFKKSKEFHPDRWVNLVNLTTTAPYSNRQACQCRGS